MLAKWRCSAAGLATLLCAHAVLADSAVTSEADAEPGTDRAQSAPFEGSSVGFSVLGGIAPPVCVGQGCGGDLGAAPSLRALMLYQPNGSWGIGVLGQVARLHWRATYIGQVDGGNYSVDSDLTAGFAGFAARWSVLPDEIVSPVAEIAVGTAFQAATGSNFGCNGGLIPTGQLGVGARARLSPDLSLFAMGSASGGIKSSDCWLSDGAPATPFVAWGYGLHVGAAFDVALGTTSSPPPRAMAVAGH